MATIPPFKTQQRFAWVGIAILAQIVLLGIIVPTFRAYSIIIITIAVNLILSTILFVFLSRYIKSIIGGIIHFVLSIGITLLVVKLLHINNLVTRDHVDIIILCMISPSVLPLFSWIAYNKNKKQHTDIEINEREKLRNRNGF